MSNWSTLRQAVIEDFHLDASGAADDHLNRAICSALEDLRLSRLDVIHVGRETYQLDRRVRAVAATRVLEDLETV